jgi:hypothetical protein
LLSKFISYQLMPTLVYKGEAVACN